MASELDIKHLRWLARGDGLSPATSQLVLDALEKALRDLADARAKLGQAWDEGYHNARFASPNRGVNPYVPAGEKER